MLLTDKKILLGVSGSIAAYKAALLVRLLVKEGAQVKVVMTQAAQDFITPLTLATLSKNPVFTSFVADSQAGTWNNHVELGVWADAMVIAPATARTLAKCANGHCDDLLSAVYLSARCPVFFAPAMDLDMYRHGSTIANLERLVSFGNQIIQAEHGELASGLVGEGRLAEPEHIVHQLQAHFATIPALNGKKVLITAGPTQESIDPVRFISNHSTGKMGYAIASAFARAGASVTLVSGPTALPIPWGVEVVRVKSAREMFEATQQRFVEADVVILAAAVADYTPAEVATQKIKKNEDTFSIALTKTADIAATLGLQKQPNQLVVGFALETQNELANAIDKLHRKNFDFIVLNSLQDANAGFGYDTNKVVIVDKDEKIMQFELKSKEAVAFDILKIVEAEIVKKA